MCTFERPSASSTTKIPRKRPKEREKRIITVAGNGKKARNFGPPPFGPPFGPPQFVSHPLRGPHPFGAPTLRGPHPSGPPPFGAPTLRGSHFFWVLAPHPLGPHHDTKNRLAKNLALAKIGRARIGQIRMAKTGLAKVGLPMHLCPLTTFSITCLEGARSGGGGQSCPGIRREFNTNPTIGLQTTSIEEGGEVVRAPSSSRKSSRR